MATDFSKIKCIAFDLDNTMLQTSKELSKRAAAALSAAEERGITLVPVSGRSWSTFPDCIRDFSGIPYAVTSNGAVICDFKTGERIHAWLLAPGDVRGIMKKTTHFFMEHLISYEAFMDGIAYAPINYLINPSAFGVPQSSVPYIRKTRRPQRYIIDFIFEHKENLDSLNLIVKSSSYCEAVERTIRDSVENVYITSSVPYRLEVSDGSCGKAAGLCHVLGLLGLSMEETLALGDGESDADMLARAGVGVAVQNATDACRESADFITDLPADEDGAAAFLEAHLLSL